MTAFRTAFHSAFALTLAATAAGCSAGPEDDLGDGPDDAFRGYEGYGDLTMFMGTQADDDDCDVWDFLGSGVQGGTASSMPGQSILSLGSGLVFDGSGNATCEIYWDGAKKLRDLETGEVLMTSSQVFLIDGDFNANQGLANWEAADYTFRDHQIREGGWWGEPVLTANVHIEWTHGYRRLLIGALIEGLCGAPGLDAAPDPVPHPEG